MLALIQHFPSSLTSREAARLPSIALVAQMHVLTLLLTNSSSAKMQSEAEGGTGEVDDEDHGLLAGFNESLLFPLLILSTSVKHITIKSSH